MSSSRDRLDLGMTRRAIFHLVLIPIVLPMVGAAIVAEMPAPAKSFIQEDRP
jgi:hypothetical protein